MLTKRVMFVLLGAVVAGASGCAPNIVSSEAGVYQGGRLYAVTTKDLDSVYAAALYAMDKLQLQVSNKAKDVFGAKVVAQSADGKGVTVTIKPTEGEKTAYNIQVSGFGNEERCRRVFAEMQSGLEIVKTK